MKKIAIIAQDKGGCGKTTLTRASAQCSSAFRIIEIESAARLSDLGERAMYFPMRCSRQQIEASGGRAAREEFDAAIDALHNATGPTLVDSAANTSGSLFDTIIDSRLGDIIDFAVVIPVTNEPAALAAGSVLFEKAKKFAKKIVVIENRMRGRVDRETLHELFPKTPIVVFEEQVLDDAAMALLQDGGLTVGDDLDDAALTKKFGFARSLRIRRDLANFKACAMASMQNVTQWLVS